MKIFIEILCRRRFKNYRIQETDIFSLIIDFTISFIQWKPFGIQINRKLLY